ncbi:MULTISPECIES: IS1182 family transposase [unclassified Pseudofrankia]|uniref:IS1182 family transposase n=1 Tax=unclassified Pseudofrankia TaxID=2994372 RepID=UPI002378E9D2|nr:MULTISPECIES: IS1182 family transposase [unclassified Pseudofrankia]MDT3439425.1 IS1182 family transposase [Pseudofrankia sp. BMG5.37]
MRAARAAARRGAYPVAMRVRDERGELFADGEFAGAFGVRGRPGWSPGRLALVTVLQMVENLTDRGAAARVRFGMDWKYALGLELDDEGFDPSVLVEFRSRLVEHGLEEKALDLLLDALAGRGLVGSGGRARTDSTHVLAAVRGLNRTELAGESVRAALEALAVAAPGWLAGAVDVAGWGRRYARRVDSWAMPSSKAEREELAQTYGQDGFALLTAVYGPGTPGWLAELPALDVLRQILVQHYTRAVGEDGREVVRRREDRDGLPPGRTRLTSPYDLDTRSGAKHATVWDGYKVHLTETCQPAGDGLSTPNLITNVVTTDATVSDIAMIEPIHGQLAARRLTPERHYVDSGYSSPDQILAAHGAHGITLVTPLLEDSSAQARAGAGYDRSRFTIDFDRRTATCPKGQTSSSWSPARNRGQDVIVIGFPVLTCRPCHARDQCTTSSGGRRLTIRPREIYQAQQAARTLQNDPDWKTDYALRAGVEGTIHQATATTGLRRSRYRGLAKTHLQHVYTAIAINFLRLDDYWNDQPLERTRTSHFARLAAA